MANNKNQDKSLTQRLVEYLRSEWAFRLSLILFAINSSCIAVTALYPMAFDEQFHLGLIKLYSTKLLPFWSTQPPGEALYGAVARDPSYLYHYLMSFPYRLQEAIIPSEYAQILILRFTSIIVFAIGIVIFRKVLLNAGLSKAITHASLLIFVLIPIVPLLAAQINYDNFTFTLGALVLWQTQKFAKQLTVSQKLDLQRFIIIALLCMFGSLFKYAFVPFVLGVVIYLFTLLYSHFKATKNIWKDIGKSYKAVSTRARYILLVLFVLLFGLFFERYGVNTIKYTTPTPECDQVLSVDECLAYSPWRRNYYTRQAKLENRLEKNFSANPVRYFVTLWLSETTFQLFFAIDGPKYDFRLGPPFRILRNLSVAVMLGGIVLIVYHRKFMRKAYHLKLFGLVTLTYCGALFSLNYIEFLNLGYPFAIQGRYLIPILPIAIAVMAAAYARSLGDQRQNLKLYGFLAAFLILVTQGGGAGTYILRSSPTWYWAGGLQSQINHYAKNVLEPINFERNIIPVENRNPKK